MIAVSPRVASCSTTACHVVAADGFLSSLTLSTHPPTDAVCAVKTVVDLCEYPPLFWSCFHAVHIPDAFRCFETSVWLLPQDTP